MCIKFSDFNVPSNTELMSIDQFCWNKDHFKSRIQKKRYQSETKDVKSQDFLDAKQSKYNKAPLQNIKQQTAGGKKKKMQFRTSR